MFRLTWHGVAVLVVGACTGGPDEVTASSDGGGTSVVTPAAAPVTTTTVTATPTSSPTIETSTTVGAPKFSSEVIGSGDSDPHGVAVALGPHGLPFVVYALEGRWALVNCLDRACTSRTAEFVPAGDVFLGCPSVYFVGELPVAELPSATDDAETGPEYRSTVHACRNRECTEADSTTHTTGIWGRVAVAGDGTTFVGFSEPDAYRLIRCLAPDCAESAEVAAFRPEVFSFKVDESGVPVFLAEGSVIRCDDQQCGDPTETYLSQLDVWWGFGDPLAGPRGGTSAFLASTNDEWSHALVTWRDDPTFAGRIVLDDIGEEWRVNTKAVAIGPKGHPVVVWNRVYFEYESSDESVELYVARCTAPDCSGGTTALLARGVMNISGASVSVAVGPDDLPVLVYHRWIPETDQDEIMLARCSNPSCTSTALEVTDWPNQ